MLALMKRYIKIGKLLPRHKNSEDLALQFAEDPMFEADAIMVLNEMAVVWKQIEAFLPLRSGVRL
jgi:hypothetical protein